MSYFTWKDAGLTADCTSLEAMASRFEEAARLMRRMADRGFVLQRNNGAQRINHDDAPCSTHGDSSMKNLPVRQLTLMQDLDP